MRKKIRKYKPVLSTIFVLAIGSGCNVQQNSFRKQVPLPVLDIEGHRGARGLMPENTIPAMIKAVDLGVTTLEMDAHITNDQQVILSHDDHINSAFTLSPGGGEISADEAEGLAFYKMPYAEISKFDVGFKIHDQFPHQQKVIAHIPLLSDVIDSVQSYLAKNGKPQVFYNIETKSKPEGDNKYHPSPEVFVKLLIEVIEEKKITAWVIIQSFDARTLQVLHKKYPHVKTAYLVESNSFEKNLAEIGFIPSIYSPNSKLVTAELVKEAHAKGIKIIPWTVNTTEEILRLIAMGVDGIISDYPDRVSRIHFGKGN